MGERKIRCSAKPGLVGMTAAPRWWRGRCRTPGWGIYTGCTDAGG